MLIFLSRLILEKPAEPIKYLIKSISENAYIPETTVEPVETPVEE